MRSIQPPEKAGTGNLRLILILGMLMALGPFIRWKDDRLVETLKRLRITFVLSLLTAAAVPLLMGRWSTMAAFGVLLAAWLGYACVGHLLARIRSASGIGVMAKMRNVSKAYYGMVLAHFGVAVFIFGVTMVKTYEIDRDVRMEPGDTSELAGYTFRFVHVGEVRGPNYVAARGIIDVMKGDRKVDTLHPEKRMYLVQQMPMTEAAIDRGFTRDFYVSLGEAVSETAWVVQLRLKPFVNWIWIGCVIMALGGLLAIIDRRYRAVATKTAGDSVSSGAVASPVR